MAQFIMVTLRKVSLTLADHHIGITHAGNGCSQRITDFDRAAAFEMSDEIEAEEKARAASQAEKEAMPELQQPILELQQTILEVQEAILELQEATVELQDTNVNVQRVKTLILLIFSVKMKVWGVLG